MKKLIVAVLAGMLCMTATAQPRGGMGMPPMRGGMMMGPMGMSDEKPFYQVESDSIVTACLYDLPFILDAKKLDKFGKLVKTEYEEVCRSLQMTVVEYLVTNEIAAGGGMMGGMRGPMMNMQPTDLDQQAMRKNVDAITKKYAKKYKKMLYPDELEQWNAIQDKRYGKGLAYLIAHVYENTDIDF